MRKTCRVSGRLPEGNGGIQSKTIHQGLTWVWGSKRLREEKEIRQRKKNVEKGLDVFKLEMKQSKHAE
jgi:hypothetical protein